MSITRRSVVSPEERIKALESLVHALVKPEISHPLSTIFDIEVTIQNNLRSETPDLELCADLSEKATKLHEELFRINIGRVNTETISILTDGANFHRSLSAALRRLAGGQELDRDQMPHLDMETVTFLEGVLRPAVKETQG